MAVPKTVEDLIERFDRNREAYLSEPYNETKLRREFIDPFFKALGWDIDNEQGYAEAYKDVIHEDSIRVGSATKAPDYCFRIGGARKFFLEAKKPAIKIADDPDPAFQLRRYAWSAKLPLSILTNFDQLAVYDGRLRPSKTDKPSKARVLHLSYTDYAKQWDQIESIFSHEAVLKGAFDKYAQTSRLKKGTAQVDDAFLAEIESWRDALARNIASRNQGLTSRELNFAVQVTLDRIIFLRICEDRGIEAYGELLAQTNGSDIYQRLLALFQRADDRYNSGLFHFRPEKERTEPPDELTPGLAIDDRPLREIIRSLYYPDCPYEFSVLPAEILGHVYEQFLGKVITLTAGHHARVEDKPEVKKAGGVYYTPTYIVDYIVKNTVGKLLEGRSVRNLKNRPPRLDRLLRILDPACGSGSFLIGAYQCLLDWHMDWYTKNDPQQWAKKKAPPIRQVSNGKGNGYRLTVSERKRILLDHIFGVDIDTQAVEVTKLSLLLRVLEGEKDPALFYTQRALPDLSNNIKCGNSLIGPDFYNGQQMVMFGEEERLRINAFDWHTEFPEVFKDGGFDAVIGNPPYIPIELMREEERLYYVTKHPQLERKYDSAPIFILAMLEKLQNHGLLGFISSITWQTGENYPKLRAHLFIKAGIKILINLPFNVFKNAYVDTGIYILSARPTTDYSIYQFPKKESVSKLDNIPFTRVPAGLVHPPDYKVILNPTAHHILQRALGARGFDPLGEFTISTQGLAGNRFVTARIAKGVEWYPFLKKGQARRYRLEIEDTAFTDMHDKQSLKRFYDAGFKLLVRRVISRQDRLLIAITEDKLVFKKDINPFIITNKDLDVFFILGILNSRLISYLYVNTSSIATKDDFRQTTLAELRSLPIPRQLKGDDCHDRMVQLVEQMLDLHKQLAKAKTPHEKTALERQIAATDGQIDRLVYDLYGLTEEEIQIVEGTTP